MPPNPQKTALLGVIPARFESKRLPGKPLLKIGSKTLLQRVWEQSSKSDALTDLIIATDDQRIFESASAFGAKVIMTQSDHPSGTDRVLEAVVSLEDQGRKYDFVANIQGDMPFLRPQLIDRVFNVLAQKDCDSDIGTPIVAITREDEFLRSNVVKVVFGEDGKALYFSRSPIPFCENRAGTDVNSQNPYGYKHIGLYLFRAAALHTFTSLPRHPLEERESLEQLRALAYGLSLQTVQVSEDFVTPSIEVDTPEDLERACLHVASHHDEP